MYILIWKNIRGAKRYLLLSNIVRGVPVLFCSLFIKPLENLQTLPLIEYDDASSLILLNFN